MENLAMIETVISMFFPDGMLDWFEINDIEETPLEDESRLIFTGGVLHIHLDERDNRGYYNDVAEDLIPNGFTEPTVMNDFPIRNRKVVLHIRRRRWKDKAGKSHILNEYPLTEKGTRYSMEFAAFLKERLGFIPCNGPFTGAIL